MTASDIQTPALQRIRADVRAMQGYHVQASQGLLKMDTMENPYRLSAELQKKLGERLGALEINRYPGERQEVLKKMLADYAGAPAGSAVLLGIIVAPQSGKALPRAPASRRKRPGG